MAQQTAVEWFFKWFNDNPEATHKEYAEAFEQAKQIEKEQIMQSNRDGVHMCVHSYILTSEEGHRVIKCTICNNIQPI